MDGGRTQVTVGYAPCDIQTLNYTQITCLTSTAGVWSGDIAVSVLSRRNAILTAVCAGDCSYSYDIQASPTLSAVSPISVSIAGTRDFLALCLNTISVKTITMLDHVSL